MGNSLLTRRPYKKLNIKVLKNSTRCIVYSLTVCFPTYWTVIAHLPRAIHSDNKWLNLFIFLPSSCYAINVKKMTVNTLSTDQNRI